MNGVTETRVQPVAFIAGRQHMASVVAAAPRLTGGVRSTEVEIGRLPAGATDPRAVRVEQGFDSP